jgi:hypothetical protein
MRLECLAFYNLARATPTNFYKAKNCNQNLLALLLQNANIVTYLLSLCGQ